MRILTWIIGIPLAVAATAFAVANRQSVTLDLWPLPFTVQLGVYLAVLGALALGLTLGMLIGGAISGGKASSRARTAEARARVLEQERDDLRARLPADSKALPAPDASA